MLHARIFESDINRRFDNPSPELLAEAHQEAYDKIISDDIELVETFCDLDTKLLAPQLRVLLEDGADHAHSVQVIRYHLKKRLNHMCEDRIDDQLEIMRGRAFDDLVEMVA